MSWGIKYGFQKAATEYPDSELTIVWKLRKRVACTRSNGTYRLSTINERWPFACCRFLNQTIRPTVTNCIYLHSKWKITLFWRYRDIYISYSRANNGFIATWRTMISKFTTACVIVAFLNSGKSQLYQYMPIFPVISCYLFIIRLTSPPVAVAILDGDPVLSWEMTAIKVQGYNHCWTMTDLHIFI